MLYYLTTVSLMGSHTTVVNALGMSMGAHKTDCSRLVQHGFFEPLGPKRKYSEEKIHLFYRIIIVRDVGSTAKPPHPVQITFGHSTLKITSWNLFTVLHC